MEASRNSHKNNGAPLDSRFVGSISGRCVITNRYGAAGRTAHVCRLLSATAFELYLSTSIAAQEADEIVGLFEHLGRLNGRVRNVSDHGFWIDISATLSERQSLANDIEWLKKYNARLLSENRANKRYKLNDKPCVVKSNGSELKCLIRDVSLNGVEVVSTDAPTNGEIIQIGNLDAEIVRQTNDGFSARFLFETSSTTSLAIADIIKDLSAR